MARKTFMAIHTYHNEKTKNEFLSDMPTTERTDVEWKEIYTFEKCRCIATWVGTDVSEVTSFRVQIEGRGDGKNRPRNRNARRDKAKA